MGAGGIPPVPKTRKLETPNDWTSRCRFKDDVHMLETRKILLSPLFSILYFSIILFENIENQKISY